jgi:site-specific DNA-methyltransferase (adenine-specific)
VTATKGGFALRGRNPDVLTCIANLSNDEVFTPPELANRMLDTLAEAWAVDNDGADIWADSDVTFLDPFTKTGIFLREITSRLTEGLEDRIPDLQARVDHILTKQIFGIGITHLTSLLARRSLYCSKFANGPHSIAKSFTTEEGNIWFERLEHTWVNNRCRFCGASRGTLDRGEGFESHAYAFIHTDEIKARIAELFGEEMHFDVIIGNPPYQLEVDAAGQNVASIYPKFVQQAKELRPRLLAMIIPSRWMAGGRHLDAFREEMLSDTKISTLVDYPVASEVFPGVEVKGGVCYFLRDEGYDGDCEVTMVRGGESIGPSRRALGEFDIFIRDPRAVEILHKVRSLGEPSFAGLVSARDPFGPVLSSNFTDYREAPVAGDVRLHVNAGTKRVIGWVSPDVVTKNADLVDEWKLLVPKAGSDGGQRIPDVVLGRPIVSEPPSVCTLTYLVVGPLASSTAARSVESYYSTKFFRFLVSLRKITQDATRHVYSYVPIQEWERTWTDAELYKKYALNDSEVAFIEAMIRPMDLNGGDSDD